MISAHAPNMGSKIGIHKEGHKSCLTTRLSSQKKSQTERSFYKLIEVDSALLATLVWESRNKESKRTSRLFFPWLKDLIHQHLMGDGITCCQKPPSACCNELVVENLSMRATWNSFFPKSTRSCPDYVSFSHPGGLRVYSWVPKMML